MSEDRSYLPLILIAILVLFSGKGGDSPSPTPDNVLAAKQAGVALLSGLADVFEETAEELERNPGSVSTIGAQVKEKTKAVREASDNELERILQDAIGSAGESSQAYRDFAKGYREAIR